MAALWSQDQFVIREKFWKIFGNTFWINDMQGNLLGYAKQKAFKLKEEIIIYADEAKTQPLVAIKARNIIDIWATYDISDATTGQAIGGAKRKGLKSFFKDAWQILDVNGNQLGTMKERSMFLALVRRIINFGNLIPQTYDVQFEGLPNIIFKQRFNPFIRRTNVIIPPGTQVDRRLIVAMLVLNSAIEGRQGGGFDMGLDI